MYPTDVRGTYREHMLRIIVVFLLASVLAGSSAAAAQGSWIALTIGGPIHSSVWVTTLDGTFLGSCTIPDNGGVHAPYCTVDVPHPSTVLVYLDETTIPAGSVVEQNPIEFSTTSLHGRDSWGGAPVFRVSQQASVSGTSDIAIVTTADGNSFYDGCFILVGYSNEGCDLNRDGDITFDDIPYGTYTLRQTRDIGSGRSVPDRTITVTGASDADGRERFHVSVESSADGSSSAVPVDIALITRAPEDGHLLTDTCYVLVGYSNEGCDENGDGQVTFAAIPPGTYTVRQTKTPAGYPAVNDYHITIPQGQRFPMGYLVRQAPEQNAPGTRNVSVVLVDLSGQKMPSDACVQIVGASNVGCDEDLRDGQIDFLDVPTGDYHLEFSNLNGIGIVVGGRLNVTVGEAPDGPTHEFIVIQVSNTGTTQPAPSAGDGEFQEMIGTWAGKRRDIEIRGDGTGQIHYRPDAFGNGIIWDIVIDPNSVPVTATIVNVTAYGNVNPADHPTVGDTVTFRLERYPDGPVIVATIGTEGRSLNGCPMDADGNVPNVSRLCY